MRRKKLTFRGADADEDYDKGYGVHIRCLPHLDLRDGFEFVTLHFELVEVAPLPGS